MPLPSARFALALALATAFAISEPMAQGSETIARLRDVHGNVLVSKESGLGTGGEQAPLTNGMRVITTANAGTTVVFDNGCEVKMQENQRLEIEKDKPCAALLPQSILAEAAGVGMGPLFLGALVPAFIIEGTALDQLFLTVATQSVSPN